MYELPALCQMSRLLTRLKAIRNHGWHRISIRARWRLDVSILQ